MSRLLAASLLTIVGITAVVTHHKTPAPSAARAAGTVLSPEPKLPRRPSRVRASRQNNRPPLRPAPGSGTLNWTALAQCESSGNPHAVDPSGTYFGLYQFDLQTWRSVGGTGNPADASPEEQRKRAWLLYIQRGRAPWPQCGRYL